MIVDKKIYDEDECLELFEFLDQIEVEYRKPYQTSILFCSINIKMVKIVLVFTKIGKMVGLKVQVLLL